MNMPLVIGQVFRQELFEESSALMKVINVFFNEDWQEICIQARPPHENQLGDTIYSFTPEHIIACPIVEKIYEKINWSEPQLAHRIFEREVAGGETLEIAQRIAEHSVVQFM